MEHGGALMPKAAVTKVEVSRAALLARLKRRLAQDEQRLITSRGAQAKASAGDFYVIDSRNVIRALRVDPARLAREMDCLEAWEIAPDFER
jgi:hypothetical protein